MLPELPQRAREGAARAARRLRRTLRRASPAVAARARGLLHARGPLKTQQVIAGAAVLGLVVAGGAVALAGPWDSSGQRAAERDWAADHARSPEPGGRGADHGHPGGGPAPAPSAPPVLAPLGAAGTGSPRAAAGEPQAALVRLLKPLLDDASLGDLRTASVVDVATGRRLYTRDSDRGLTPASTTKLATATAALSALGPDHRFTTSAVLAPDGGRLVLVGGGDPTLTARADPHGAASLPALAESTARALTGRGVHRVSLGYDTSRFTGGARHPIGVNENLAPVTALMVDEGRLDDSSSGPADRSTDPARDAARTFAALLRKHGVRVSGKPAPARAPEGAKSVASVDSPALASVVERMLTNSDNDIAEALARQTALATHGAPGFAGGAAAVRAQLARLKMPLKGAEFHDGSGLDRDDRLTAGLLTSLLAAAGDQDRPELRPVLTGLPVAGFSGTLKARYGDDTGALGLVRAKTGTLTGVNTLAGTVADADGRVLAFAFMTSGSASPADTEAALDRLAAALADCGCGD
ncbi:D-alanyl-D-alanine carboxypeptidase/D-alanyl-D-alanine-endopeptidase [Streptomyces sp. NPDC050560]|uniref:D-alanyl-D-alanine carboxypeptidase/D-alanyl-D-alanine endopeptidase n=1 Tax=Streptomyces sp. NPDC050560 TaxID=3365630 RepID=UPI00378C42D0